MKEYPKKYEDIYTPEIIAKKCDFTRLETVGMEPSEYIKKMREIFLDFELSFFQTCLKLYWLSMKFKYSGRIRDIGIGRRPDWTLDAAWGFFMRKYVRISGRLVSSLFIYRIIISYIKDFFPGIESRNPLEEKLEYPYKHMRFEHLILVHQLEERLELLEKGEKEEMDIIEFLNYCSNYVGHVNEESVIPKYMLHKQNPRVNLLPTFLKNKYYEERT